MPATSNNGNSAPTNRPTRNIQATYATCEHMANEHLHTKRHLQYVLVTANEAVTIDKTKDNKESMFGWGKAVLELRVEEWGVRM